MKNILLSSLIFLNLSSCYAQSNKATRTSNYKIITSFLSDENFPEKTFINNNYELRNIYKLINFNNKYRRSLPIYAINFNKDKVALLKQKNISSYNIDSVLLNKKNYEINLSQIKDFDYKNNYSNVIMVVIPKSVENIFLKINK